MTVREKLEEMLTAHGLWLQEAKAVFDSMLKEEGDSAGMKDVRWNGPADGYPVQLYAVLFLTLSDYAVKWIDENKPKHFARMLFVPRP